jgi:hypothetical protein
VKSSPPFLSDFALNSFKCHFVLCNVHINYGYLHKIKRRMFIWLARVCIIFQFYVLKRVYTKLRIDSVLGIGSVWISVGWIRIRGKLIHKNGKGEAISSFEVMEVPF